MKPNAKQKAAPEASPSTAPSTRRRFLTWLWVGLGVIATAEALWLVASYLMPGRRPSVRDETSRWIEAGAAAVFTPKTVAAFPRGRFYLACLEDGGFLALSRRCTHLGCTVPWNAETGRFECPCHSSVFDIRGEVLRSPAQRALDIHPVTIENGIVRVDAGRVIERGAFRPDQVVYPE